MGHTPSTRFRLSSISGIIGPSGRRRSKPPDSPFQFIVEERTQTRHALFFLIIALAVLGTVSLVQVEGLGWIAASRILGIEIAILFGAFWYCFKGKIERAAQIICFSALACGLLLMAVTGVGFREIAMQLFPLLLIIAALLLPWSSYLAYSGLVLTGVTGVGLFLVKTGTRLNYPKLMTTVSMLVIIAVAAGLLVHAMRSTLTKSRESERRFRELLDNVRLAATIINPNGIVLYCNEFLLTSTGWSRDEVIGQPVLEFVAPDDRGRVMDTLKTSLAAGQVVPFHESAVLTRDGKHRWIEWSNASLFDARGAILGFASIGVDVTDHRRLQEQFLQAQKLEILGRLAGAVAHDFNNFLTVIQGYGDLVFRRLNDGDPVRADVDQIRQAALKATDLTQQLLAFSRKQKFQPRPVDLNQAVEASRGMLTLLLGGGVDLILHLDESLELVMADPGQLNQVLMNLAANARDAMPRGGKFTIETARSENPAAASVMLSVTDTGIGMSQETQQHIFEPFFTTKEEGKGTGLGLATVYGVVKQNQGSISVISAPGKGTTFTIVLPMINVRTVA